jgi:glyceraldehyde 3-phosphate dehydrogenase
MRLADKPVIKIGINGAGRIGMGFFKQVLFNPSRNGQQIQVVALNDIAPIKNIANSIPYDAIHQHPKISIKVDDGKPGLFSGNYTGSISYSLNGSPEGKLAILNEMDAKTIPWFDHGVDIVIDATGVNKTKEKAEGHLQNGVSIVVVSAPSNGDIPMIVMGYNEGSYKPEWQVISGASCTTNCVVPPLALLHEQFGVEWVYIFTVHSITGDQRSVGGPHEEFARGQTLFSIAPTKTGAAKATGIVIPDLKDKIDEAAISYRVPVYDGSIVDLTATLKNPPKSAVELNEYLKLASMRTGSTMSYSDDKLVSNLIIGNPSSGIVDAQLTKMFGDKAHVRIWYDNEMGYINQLRRLVEYIVKNN